MSCTQGRRSLEHDRPVIKRSLRVVEKCLAELFVGQKPPNDEFDVALSHNEHQ
jgi:hypothetical protein